MPAATTEFTPFASACGGALIGLSAVLLLLFSGRIAGISGLLRRLLVPRAHDRSLDAAGFIAGLLAAPLVWKALSQSTIAQTVSDNLALLAFAGLLVGFGAVWGGGCTSGHGVCGLSRLSPRSVVATAVFMVVAIATVFVTRHVFGAAA